MDCSQCIEYQCTDSERPWGRDMSALSAVYLIKSCDDTVDDTAAGVYQQQH
jgi:hypothetical protein